MEPLNFYFYFLGTRRCSRVTSSSVFRNNSWECWGNIWEAENQISVGCVQSKIPICYIVTPAQNYFLFKRNWIDSTQTYTNFPTNNILNWYSDVIINKQIFKIKYNNIVIFCFIILMVKRKSYIFNFKKKL